MVGLKYTFRSIAITVEFNAGSLNWITGTDVVFDTKKRIFSIELPSQWSDLMNRPNQPEISIRWTAVKFSKLTISDRHDDSKWCKTSFKLNKHTNKSKFCCGFTVVYHFNSWNFQLKRSYNESHHGK